MKNKKNGASIFFVILAIIAIAAGVFVLLEYKDRQSVKSMPAQVQTSDVSGESETVQEKTSGTKITWQGKEYTYNQSIRNILFIGVDKKEEMQIQDYAGRGGQADCLILLSLNTREKTATMLNISRDSIVDVDIYDMSGDFLTEEIGMKEAVQNIPNGKIRKEYISKDKDPFMLMFLRDYCLRPSCYECKAKENKLSDLTMADFWGIQKVAPEMNDNRGISLVLVRTQKGMEIFNRICKNMVIKEVSYEDGVRSNPADYRSAARPSQRDNFFVDMHNLSFDELTAKYAVPAKISVKTKMKRIIKNAIKKITPGGGVFR